jgi:mono/diheme cytochrome c family protein
MRTSFAVSALAALSLAATAARPASAQGATTHPADSAGKRTTRSGVYTAAQAERGEEVYAGFCRSCHTAASHTGATFASTWKGRSMADLYGYVAEQMPKNDPGGLAAEQYADVVAYLLRVNAMPAGRTELAPDPTALGAIRIDLAAPARRSAPAKRAPAKRTSAKGTPVRKNPQ